MAPVDHTREAFTAAITFFFLELLIHTSFFGPLATPCASTSIPVTLSIIGGAVTGACILRHTFLTVVDIYVAEGAKKKAAEAAEKKAAAAAGEGETSEAADIENQTPLAKEEADIENQTPLAKEEADIPLAKKDLHSSALFAEYPLGPLISLVIILALLGVTIFVSKYMIF